MDFISSLDDRKHGSKSGFFQTELELIKEIGIKKTLTIYKYLSLIKKLELLSNKMTYKNRIIIISSYILYFAIVMPVGIFIKDKSLSELIMQIGFLSLPIFIAFYRLYEITIYNQGVFIQKTIIKLGSEIINYDELDGILTKTNRIYNIYCKVLGRKGLIKLMYGEKYSLYI